MRTEGTAAELERRRLLAVERLQEGYSAEQIADFLGVTPRSVRRWDAAFQQGGVSGLAAQPATGRPPKLSRTQEKVVGRWLTDSPTEHGFDTELWTAARLAQLIDEEWSISFNPRYLAAWLRDRDFSPQKPQRIPRERDPKAIAAWLATDWPRIKKRRGGAGRRWP
jgi:transposase